MKARQPNTPPDLAAALAAQNWPDALRIAARYRALGDGKTAIMQAWNAHQRPDFYRSIGHDPEALMQAGIQALRARFLQA